MSPRAARFWSVLLTGFAVLVLYIFCKSLHF